MSVNPVLAPSQPEQESDVAGCMVGGFKVKVADEAEVVVARVQRLQIDLKYEFSAPKYFDFCEEETELDIAAAEHWFEAVETFDPPRPWPQFRLVGLDGVGLSVHAQDDRGETPVSGMEICQASPPDAVGGDRLAQEAGNRGADRIPVSHVDGTDSDAPIGDPGRAAASGIKMDMDSANAIDGDSRGVLRELQVDCNRTPASAKEPCGSVPIKRMYAEGWKDHLQSAMKRISKSFMLRRSPSTKKKDSSKKEVPDDSQAQKKQKLEGGRQKQVSDTKQRRKSAPGCGLTQPHEPHLATAARVRPPTVKSTEELEQEELAKVPKFKARPLNKKIFKSKGDLGIFRNRKRQVTTPQEFHFATDERSTSKPQTVPEEIIHSSELKKRRKSAPGCGLTQPHEPTLATALRARPTTVKSREQIEEEELAKVPKFKARPFNAKIFLSKGDLGIFRTRKREVTTPQEFHFATDERLAGRPHLPLLEFSQLSLNSGANEEPLPQLTVPEPFHLETEERGFVKSVKFMTELAERERQEQEARVPKANPLPFTTDYVVVPPKPQPKECTRPEPFHLESLIRHEEEMQKKAEEEAARAEQEAAARAFRALPNLSNLPVVIPERPRKPLTEVEEFQFHVDVRAVERAEFDKKVAEKQNEYKRFREEYEYCKKLEEEREIKAIRREMVPHARPMPLFARPFQPQRSCKELTRPVSPRLRVRDRRERRRTSITSLQRRTSQLR